MHNTHPRLIKNSNSKLCSNCGGVHEYITKLSPHTRSCDTPIAFSQEKANKLARLVARGNEDVVPVPDDTVIVLDDSARKLPHNTGPARLAQFDLVEGSM